MKRTSAALVLLVAIVLAWAPPSEAQPSGTMTWGIHVTLATRWLDPLETDSEITPFMILYALHDALVLEAFDGYWRKVPSVKRLVFRSVPDETTRAAALKKGDVDVVYFINGPIAEEVRRTPGLTLVPTRTNGVLWLEFPEQWDPKSPWADRRVRLAA